jgi:TRAP-type C4-dicarboxylate transport system substrate-binding protein
LKKTKWLMIASVFLLMLSACDSGETNKKTSTTSNDTQKLIASSGFPAADRFNSSFVEPLLEAVEKESDGEVAFDIFSSGELIDLGNELNALDSDTIDIATGLAPSYDPKRFPYSGVVALPLLKSSSSIAAEALENLMQSDYKIKGGKTFYELEFEDKGLVAFPLQPTESYIISTTGAKFDSSNDFNSSIRIRTSSSVHDAFIKELGLTSVSLPGTEIYDGMSRGSLDGVMMSIADMPAYGVEELSKYMITGLSIGHFVSHVAMKQETWDSLSPKVQKLFEENSHDLIHSSALLYKEDEEKAIENNKENGGELIPFNDLNPDVQEKLNKAIVDTWEIWIEDLESQGHAGKEIALLWRDLLVDAGAEVPQGILDLK